MNDNTVLGGVRATEGQGFTADNVIGIGINGVDAVNELAKAQQPVSTVHYYLALMYTVSNQLKCCTNG